MTSRATISETEDDPVTLAEACETSTTGAEAKKHARLIKKRASNLRWQRANRDKVAINQRRWLEKASSKAKQAANRHRWRQANKERDGENRRRWRRENRSKANLTARKVHLKRKYGITIEQRNAILAAQDFRCAICRSDSVGWEADWLTDHCHETGKVRGLLCHHCNRIVHQKATPEVLYAAAEYLKRFLESL